MNETGFKKYNVLQIFIGFVIIGAILYTLDFDKTIDILKEINLGFLMMAVCAYFFYFLPRNKKPTADWA